MEFAHKLFSTRGGTLALAGLAALIAAIVVFAYVKHYRNSVEAGGTPATVLVSSGLIAKGTAGGVIATKHLFQAQSIRESQLREGAISDPVSLRGRVAKTDILPGQQLTVGDFVSAKGGGLASELIGVQRAISISIDSAHGLIGQVSKGDRVDVYAGFSVNPVDSLGRPIGNGQARPVLRLIMQNIPVLNISKASGLGATSDSQVTLKTNDYQAQKLAFASDNGKVWLALRPPSGAKAAKPSIVTVETLLLGVSPVAELRTFGGKS